VGWNYVKSMSEDNHLTVLYGLAGNHMGDVEEVQQSSEAAQLKNVRFVSVLPTVLARLLNWPNRSGLLPYSFYLAYRVWHRSAYRVAKEIIAREAIDVVHYLCPIGYREPGQLWKLDKPYIWGPVGGVANRPAWLYWERSRVDGTKAAILNAGNVLQLHFSRRVRRALHRADLMLTATSEAQTLLLGVHGVTSLYLPENAIDPHALHDQRLLTVPAERPIELIWVGTINARKALDILLNALATVPRERWHLTVVGDGEQRERMVQLSQRLGISEDITWTGNVTRDRVHELMKHSHLHAISSLHEATTTVLWEAMACGVPTISLDHCGMHDVICDRCGLRVPISNLRDTTIAYGAILATLLREPTRLEALSRGVIACTGQFTWTTRRGIWNSQYCAAIECWNHRQLSK
jgi:glycosyltransferase involved in cell wall biosynthesis